MTTKITEQNISNLANAGVDWQSVKTSDFTAVAGEGYFVNTTSAAITVTLPASPSAGDVVVLKDYARTWGTNAVSLASTTFDGASNTPSFSTNGQTVTLVYMDGTKGWSLINEDTTTGLGPAFISATGGTVTESGDYKIHTFTGDGCFVVSQVGNPAGSTSVDYLVIAGGGGGAGDRGGGGGGGGFRESSGAASGCYSTSPLGACVAALPVSATTYPITVGGGGSAGAGGPGCAANGTQGSNSVFSTITSTGGGFGGTGCAAGTPSFRNAGPGGSGGGGGSGNDAGGTAGSGNTPPVSPPQGNNGGAGEGPSTGGAGGGGATATGQDGGQGGGNDVGGNGGAGASSSITGSSTDYAGGGGGGASAQGGQGGGAPAGTGNGFGAGNGTSSPAGDTYPVPASHGGFANTGGGGGGGHPSSGPGAAGGKGIVIIRYKFQ